MKSEEYNLHTPGPGELIDHPMDEGLYKELAQRMSLAESFAGFGYWKYYYQTRTMYLSDTVFAKILELPIPDRHHMSVEELFRFIVPSDTGKVQELVSPEWDINRKAEYRIRVGGRIKFLYNKVMARGDAPEKFAEGYVQDVTEMVEQRAELEALRYGMDSIDEEVFGFDIDGVMFYANKQARQRYNIDFSSGKNYLITTLNHEFNPARFQDLLAKLDGNMGKHSLNSVHITAGGTRIPVSVVLYKSKGVDGNEKVWAYSRDMTDSMEQARKIKELDSIIDAILDNAPIMLYIRDMRSKRYLYWNAAMEHATNIPALKAVGSLPSEIFPSWAEVDRLTKIDESLIKKGGSLEYIDRLRASNGETRTVKTIKTVIDNPDSLMIVGVSLDITDMQAAEQNSIKARLAADKSNRIKSAILTYFCRRVAGKLSESLSRSDKNQEITTHFIRTDMETLVEESIDILDIVDPKTSKTSTIKQPFDVSDLCAEVFNQLSGSMPQGVELIFDKPEKDVSVAEDSRRIRKILADIITASSRYVSRGFVRFTYSYAGGSLEISVKDNGAGTTKELLDQMQARFVNLESPEEEQDGAMKMLLCKMAIEKMGGQFAVNSIKDLGSSFSLSIPCNMVWDGLSGELTPTAAQPAPMHDVIPGPQAAPEQPAAPPTAASKPRREGPARVLVAEDVDSNYQLLQALIGRAYKLTRAHTGLEALTIFRDGGGEESYDIILMDMKMPEMSGTEATREIRKLSLSIPIIALTANAFNDDRVEALSAGCNDFLTKPVSSDLLKKTIEKFTAQD